MQIVEQLEGKVQQLTEELIGGAAAIAAVEARAAAAEADALSSLQARRTAEEHAAALRRRVADEVAAQLRAAGSDRDRWPPAAVQEVRAAEAKCAVAASRVNELEASCSELQGRQRDSEAQLQRWQERVRSADVEVSAAQAEAQLTVTALEKQLRGVEDELSASKARARQYASAGRDCVSAQVGSPTGATTWGGGGSDGAGLAGGMSLSLVEGGAVDVAQLRGVLFGLLGAVAAGKAQERDALLPVVGMMVGASPAECKQLQQQLTQSWSGGVLESFWPAG